MQKKKSFKDTLNKIGHSDTGALEALCSADSL